MKCLYCSKELTTPFPDEMESSWHRKCVKDFFGTVKIPYMDISDEQLKEIADSAVNQGITVPGVQKKISLHLSGDEDIRLTIVDYPTGFILKPQTEEYESLPEFEFLAMHLADIAGIKTVPHGLVKLNGRYAYITKRIDRNISGNTAKLYAMEDFCQLSNRLTSDKYKGSYENCAKIIKQFSHRPGLDLSELFLRVVFSFIIGNSDMHLKNFSLVEAEPSGRQFCLSGAYDMLPVNIIIPEDNDQLALTLNGKRSRIHRRDFLAFADTCGISLKAAGSMMDMLCSMADSFLTGCDQSYISVENKGKTRDLILNRIRAICSS
ncbi:MAG TPA: HipA domain-containing protein [Clostridia bacterium]|nr:HipA domain-containing protein [Clostridia bacterium]HRX41169.1 HipA domain-containing protein [Clostridia bacterium]